jgi:branched-chain amino acid transport system substrate-binding protein
VLSVASGLHDELKEGAAGVIVTQIVPYPFTVLGTPVVREYQDIISQSADKKFSYNSMEGFLTAKAAVRAMQKTSGPITRAKIISALEAFNNEDLGGYPLSYSKSSNLGSRFVNLTMIRSDGTFVK